MGTEINRVGNVDNVEGGPIDSSRGDRENVERRFRQDLQDWGKWDIRDDRDNWDCRGCRVRRGRPVWRPSREGRRWGTAIPPLHVLHGQYRAGAGWVSVEKGVVSVEFS